MVTDQGEAATPGVPLRVERDPEAWRAEARRHRGFTAIGIAIIAAAAAADFGFGAVGLLWAGLAIGGLFAVIFGGLALRARRRSTSADPWLLTLHEEGLEYPELGILRWAELDHLQLSVRSAAPGRDTSAAYAMVHLSAYVTDPDALNARLVGEGRAPRFSAMFAEVFRDVTHTVPPPQDWLPSLEGLADRHGVPVQRPHAS